jgi:hypothetical protein
MAIPTRSELIEMASEVLDVSVDVSDVEVQEAWREGVNKYHPDTGEDSDADMFKAVDRARSVYLEDVTDWDNDKLRSALSDFEKVGIERPDSVTGLNREEEGFERTAGDTVKDKRASGTAEQKEAYEAETRMSITVLVDLVVSEVMVVFKQEVDEEQINERIEEYIFDQGYGGLQFSRMTIKELARVLEPLLRDDVSKDTLEGLLKEADQELQNRFSGAGNMFVVSHTLGAMLAGGMINIADIGGSADSSPDGWVRPNRGSGSGWSRSR